MSRFANLPTVWSNVLVAALLGGALEEHEWGKILLLCIPLSFLYLGGCFLNDWYDAEFDQENRPDRAIPSGRWSRQTILKSAVILMLTGVTLCFLWSFTSGAFSTLLLISIIVYTVWHKSRPISILFMACARLLVYPTAFFAFAPPSTALQESTTLPFLYIAAASMAAYILGISVL